MKNKNMEFAIRVTDNCNLNCDYCYAKVDKPVNMSIKTLEKVLKRIINYCSGNVTISWTGGEPLILEKDFFEKIVEIQKKSKKITFINILQTNLVYLDDWFINFLSKNKFQVRTSLDLPPEYHDKLRIKNNFDQTLKKIKQLQAANVQVNINTVITNLNVDSAKEIYKFLKKNNVSSFSVSRFILQGNALQNKDLVIQGEARFGKFLIQLFDLWVNDKKKPLIKRITPLDNLTNACKFMLQGKTNPNACFHCQQQILAINPKGNIYPSCNKFFGFPETCFGNIENQNIKNILESKQRITFLKKIKKITGKICSDCKYNSICKGGCFYVAFATNLDKITSREQFCKGYYFVFDHIVKHLKKMNKNE